MVLSCWLSDTTITSFEWNNGSNGSLFIINARINFVAALGFNLWKYVKWWNKNISWSARSQGILGTWCWSSKPGEGKVLF